MSRFGRKDLDKMGLRVKDMKVENDDVVEDDDDDEDVDEVVISKKKKTLSVDEGDVE